MTARAEMKRAPEPNFAVSALDAKLIRMIVSRAVMEYQGMDLEAPNRLSLEMDLCAAHNSCPLRLADLLAADGFNFIHDVSGIMRHMDRRTGELKGHFCPRFAKPESRTA